MGDLAVESQLGWECLLLPGQSSATLSSRAFISLRRDSRRLIASVGLPNELNLAIQLLHKFHDDPMSSRLQTAELDYLVGSQAEQTVLSENYVGLPYEKFE